MLRRLLVGIVGQVMSVPISEGTMTVGVGLCGLGRVGVSGLVIGLRIVVGLRWVGAIGRGWGRVA